MKIHEFQGKQLFRQAGVPVLRGTACTTPEQAEQAARELASPVVVVKSQIHAGGRGKGTVWADQAMSAKVLDGGVKLARSPEEARTLAGQLLGNWLQTKQTGGTAKRIHTVYVEDGCKIAKELYLSVLLDRAVGLPVLVASREGGMDIEEVAEHRPAAILKVHVEPHAGLGDWQARRLGYEMGLTPAQVAAFVKTAKALVQCFLATDADMVEVNPLVITADDQCLALDAKMSFDDNALFRHPEIAALLDPNEEDPAELEAKSHDMAFVKLDGNIGCMVNGAGLAMATMDAIALYGGELGAFPANFLDVGGGATAEKVTTAFKIILKDAAVEAILVNIFGGIMKCDTIATGVLTAVLEVGLDRPLVVRLEGTRVEEGRKLIADSGLPVINASDLRDGCRKAAEAAAQYRAGKGLPPRPALPPVAPIAYVPPKARRTAAPAKPKATTKAKQAEKAKTRAIAKPKSVPAKAKRALAAKRTVKRAATVARRAKPAAKPKARAAVKAAKRVLKSARRR
jgi:succinyl-CoA synthetase beta subunit